MIENSIRFYNNHAIDNIEILRLSKDGIWVNPEIPADEAAKLVLEAIDYNIKVMVQKAVEDEREACAKVCEDDESKAWDWSGNTRVGNYFARAIRARGSA